MHRTGLAKALGIAGVSVLVLAFIVSLGELSLANPASITYYYYETPHGTIYYLNITAENEVVHPSFYVGGIPVNASVGGTSCTAKLLVANLTAGQLSYLGAGEARYLRPLVRMDIISEYTGLCGASLSFHVSSSSVRAYYWTGSSWSIIPGQSISPYSDHYLLTVPIPNGFTGTPVILASPSAVGGTLLLGSKANLSLALLATGIALIAAAAALIYAERRGQQT